MVATSQTLLNHRLLDPTGAVAPGLGKLGALPALLDSARPADELTATAQKFIAQTFFGTLLKQMRDSPFRSQLFEGGRGGQAFTSMFDQRLVEHMSRGVGRKLADSIARRLQRRKAYGAQDNPDRSPSSSKVKSHVAAGLRA